MTTGERIKMVRKQQKLSQADFAKEIAVSATTVCQLEVGKYNISRTTKHILCSRFHINPEWLDTGEGEMFSTVDLAEDIIPDLVEILNENKSLLRAVRHATKTFSVDDWKKLNLFISSLEEVQNDNW